MAEHATREVIESLVKLAQRRGDGRVSLGDAIVLARALGIRARLLCGTDCLRVKRFVALTTSDPTPIPAGIGVATGKRDRETGEGANK